MIVAPRADATGEQARGGRPRRERDKGTQRQEVEVQDYQSDGLLAQMAGRTSK